jgi:hypothetical protein
LSLEESGAEILLIDAKCFGCVGEFMCWGAITGRRIQETRYKIDYARLIHDE